MTSIASRFTRTFALLTLSTNLPFTCYSRAALASATQFRSYNRISMANNMDSSEAAYIAALRRIYTPPNLAYRHSLTLPELFDIRSRFFLQLFKSCHLDERQVILVSGTKGKGSTVEFIASGLIAQGYRVGVFTSPHLHTARERIKINRSLISRQDFIELSVQTQALMSQHKWAIFFDYLLCMAILYFGGTHQTPHTTSPPAPHTTPMVDYVILECGIGGLWDSTNFLPSACASVVTSISFDHMDMLGDGIEDIAHNEGGIMKKNCVAFTTTHHLSTHQETIAGVLRRNAREVGARLVEVQGGDRSLAPLGFPSFLLDNACLAREVLRYIKSPHQYVYDNSHTPDTRDASALFAGMQDFYWPCRMETFEFPSPPLTTSHAPVVDHPPPPPHKPVTVVLDGSHNEDSIHRFITSLREKYLNDEDAHTPNHTHHHTPSSPTSHQSPHTKLIIVYGASVGKSVGDMVRCLVADDGVSGVCMVSSKHFKSIPYTELYEYVPPEHRYKIMDLYGGVGALEGVVGGEGKDFIERLVREKEKTEQLQAHTTSHTPPQTQDHTHVHTPSYTPTNPYASRGGTVDKILAYILSHASELVVPSNPHTPPTTTDHTPLTSEQAPSITHHRATAPTPPVRIVVGVCGSLFVAADAREFLFSIAPQMFRSDDWVRQLDPPVL